jgi:hypothetical protein
MAAAAGSGSAAPGQGGRRRWPAWPANWLSLSREDSRRLAHAIDEARAAALDDWTSQLRVWLRAEGVLGGMFIREMARALAELEFYYYKMHVNIELIIEEAATRWEEERMFQARTIAGRLVQDPEGVARTLEQTRHGAEYLLSEWRTLGAMIEEMGGLSEWQRRLAFDLLGVPHRLRHGTTAVPAGNDKLALLDLVNCEIVRLQTRQEERLNELDRMERELALQGVPLEPDDETTRELQSGIAQEMKRLSWAREQLEHFRLLAPGRSSPSNHAL